jgi:preprotein translocase subunit SecA
MLKKRGVTHNVLNAKFHEKEADIISKAGYKGAVTIATNMAGRGTDIVLEEGVPELGGLAVLGTERHESRRIDNQLRGRCGRQGDNGFSKFYVSLEDDLMRLFGSDKIKGIMETLGFDDDTPIEHKLLSNSIERAQKKVEMYHFNIRKQLLEYDDVMNKQRDIIYKKRRQVLEQFELNQKYEEMIRYQLQILTDYFFQENVKMKDADWPEFYKEIRQIIPAEYGTKQDYKNRSDVYESVSNTAIKFYHKYISQFNSEDVYAIERLLFIQSLDVKWIEHLKNMDLLREGIGLRAYAQKDPLLEYKREGYEMFQIMMDAVEEEVISNLFKIQIVNDEEADRLLQQDKFKVTSYQGGDERTGSSGSSAVHKGKKVGRNELCPCGSGKKHKKCCGKNG